MLFIWWCPRKSKQTNLVIISIFYLLSTWNPDWNLLVGVILIYMLLINSNLLSDKVKIVYLIFSVSCEPLSHFSLSKVLTGVRVLNPPVVAIDGCIISIRLWNKKYKFLWLTVDIIYPFYIRTLVLFWIKFHSFPPIQSIIHKPEFG